MASELKVSQDISSSHSNQVRRYDTKVRGQSPEITHICMEEPEFMPILALVKMSALIDISGASCCVARFVIVKLKR